jgi:hypothetical protein
VAANAIAGLKYWDNGNYDADSYVTNGLSLHYDGIRNVGLGRPHSTTAAKWANLAQATYDMAMDWVSYTGDNDSSITRTKGNTTQGQWNDANGFVFNGRVAWMKWNNHSGADAVVIPAQYTMQFAMTAAAADQTGDGQTGYLFTPHDSFDWNNGGVAVRSSENTGVTAANAIYAVDLGRIGDQNKRPHFSNENPKYVTVLENSSSLCVFGGTALPSSGDSGYVALNGTATERRNNWIAIGGLGKRTATTKAAFQGFNGTLHSYRLYSRALTEEELAWNRVVDEKRFFGTQLPIPATNAVIRSNIRRASGPEPVGCYAVDASGYTFTAPATTNLNGHTYTLISATKETWSAGVWGAAEAVAVGANGASVSVASSDLVRISWKWQPVGGAFTAADYSIDDIVTDGLVLHYDGILNNGIGKTHDDASLYWQNLAEGYEDWPLVRVDYTDDNNDGSYDAVRSTYYSTHAGEWSANGFVFDGYECMMKWNDSGDHKFVLYPECTFQFAMTASTADQAESNGGISYLFFPRNDLAQGDWQGGSISIRSTADANIGIPAGSVLMTDSARYGSTDIRPSFSNPNPRFANVVADSAAVRVFESVKWPTSGNGYKAGVLSTSRTSNWFAIGGQYNPQTGRAIKNFQGFHGTLHSIRYYDRALAEWELKRNRNVDSARFFGELGVTNVVVEVEEGLDVTATPAAGVYAVEGEYSFSATLDGSSSIGYRLWDWNEATGTWESRGFVGESSYTYDTSTATAAKQKIRWCRQRGLMIIMR